MSFFRINLNKLEDPNVALRKQRRENSWFLLLGLLFAALSAWVLLLNQRLEDKLSRFRSAKADLQAQIRELESETDYISEKDVRALDALEAKRIFWASKLSSLGSLVDRKVALSYLRYEHGVLHLQGIAKVEKADSRFDIISRFIDELKAHPDFERDFKRVEFVSSNRMYYDDQQILSFEVACNPN